MSRLTTAAAVTALAVLAAGCGEDENAEIIDALKAQGASESQAECLVDELGADGAEAMLQSGDEAPENATEVLAAIERCGFSEDDPDQADEADEADNTPPDDAAAPAGPPIDDVATCLIDAGLQVTTADGPPQRIDVFGSGGTGALYWYDTEDQAANAAEQFTDTFADAEEFRTGAVGPVGWYFQDSAEGIAAVESCLAS